MDAELLVGLGSGAVGAVLFFLGLPKRGESPKFLQNGLAEILFPVIVLFFLVVAAGQLISHLY